MKNDNIRIRKFKIVLQEVEDNGINSNQCNTIRNILSDLPNETGIQLAWCNAMLDANITHEEASLVTMLMKNKREGNRHENDPY